MKTVLTRELVLNKGKFCLSTHLTRTETCDIINYSTVGIYIINETKCVCGEQTCTKLHLATPHGGGVVEGDINSMFQEPIKEVHDCTELIRYSDLGVHIDITKNGEHLSHVIDGNAIMITVLDIDEVISMVKEDLWRQLDERQV